MEAGQPFFRSISQHSSLAKPAMQSAFISMRRVASCAGSGVDLFNQMIPIIDRDAALLNNYFEDIDRRFLSAVGFGYFWT
jgi:hypothetical protein